MSWTSDPLQAKRVHLVQNCMVSVVQVWPMSSPPALTSLKQDRKERTETKQSAPLLCSTGHNKPKCSSALQQRRGGGRHSKPFTLDIKIPRTPLKTTSKQNTGTAHENSTTCYHPHTYLANILYSLRIQKADHSPSLTQHSPTTHGPDKIFMG